jgi:hypothetical protein
MFTGAVIPETLMPVPVALTPEIVNCESPEFVSRIVCVVAAPVGTVPKLTEAGVAVKPEVPAVPTRLMAVGESVAELVTVICSENSPDAVGLNPAVSVAAWFGASVSGRLRLESVKPEPEVAIEEIFTLAVPVFFNWIAVDPLLPVATVPKFTLEGFAVNCVVEDAVAVALQPIASVAFVALLVTVKVPEAFPAAVGLNIALKLALAPAARVTGSESPDTEIPAPEAETREIVMLDDPELVSDRAWADWDPTVTVPKLSEAGLAVKSETFATPVAVNATIIGEFGALLLIIIFPLAGPLAAAVNVAATAAVWPAASAMGTEIAFSVKPDPAIDTPETVKDLVPVFVIVKDCDALCPTVREPKLTVDGDTWIDKPVAPLTPGLPVTPTHPEVISMPTTTNMVAAVFRMVGKEAPRNRKPAFTLSPSRMGVSFITYAVWIG